MYIQYVVYVQYTLCSVHLIHCTTKMHKVAKQNDWAQCLHQKQELFLFSAVDSDVFCGTQTLPPMEALQSRLMLCLHEYAVTRQNVYG